MNDFLVELGTEELPPKALPALMHAFARDLGAALTEARLEHGKIAAYGSPRRLAVLVSNLALQQEDRSVTQKGPPVRIAFDDNDQPTAAAQAFAKKCGVAVDALEREQTAKGEWLSFTLSERGRSSSELLPELVDKALATLPAPRRMRWGDGDAEFVRPVHWLLMLHGNTVIDAEILGVRSGNTTRGHRFHSAGAIEIESPAEYLQTLEQVGFVIADFDQRRSLIEKGVVAAAESVGGRAVLDDALLDEVTALVEWPVPVVGGFAKRFLELPREVIISTLTGHQRYFPIATLTDASQLLPKFVTVANIESTDPAEVRDGNERVVRPRLADAAFFWDTDRRQPLAGRSAGLREVVYQRALGTLSEKSQRVAGIAALLVDACGADASVVQRAAELAKCDLLTGMVGEFPELQGTMGQYYARADDEPAAVASAIGEHYRPRFAGDELPATPAGRALALADKLDTLAGIFSIGKRPSGNRDPFGLRRAALGTLRILVECDIDVDLSAAIESAVNAQPPVKNKTDSEVGAMVADLRSFFADRLRSYFLERDDALRVETLEAVQALQPVSPLDFGRRLAALQTFMQRDEADSLAAANKRIANILRKAEANDGNKVNVKLFSEDAERALHDALQDTAATVRPHLDARQYDAALQALAALRNPVDRFFDDVMVMADDEAVRNNRLALLDELRALFLGVADISRLALD